MKNPSGFIGVLGLYLLVIIFLGLFGIILSTIILEKTNISLLLISFLFGISAGVLLYKLYKKFF